jgi:hypothetical protein
LLIIIWSGIGAAKAKSCRHDNKQSKTSIFHIYFIYSTYPKRSYLSRETYHKSMTEITVESMFGTDAGIVWEALSQNGPSTIENIVKTTGLRREFVYGALGWLGRENKIVLEKRGRAMVISLMP